MEKYETALIQLVEDDGDVIAASITRCECGAGECGTFWAVYYSDGSYEEVIQDNPPYPACE